MRYLFADDFLGPEAWRAVGDALPPDAEVEYLVPEQPRTYARDVIALGALAKLKADFGGQRFDFLVASGGTCGPAARAALDGLATRTVLIDPHIVDLRSKSAIIQRYISGFPLGEFTDSMAEATEPYAGEMSQGNPGPALEAAMGPYIHDATDRWILDRGKEIMAQRMPFDESLIGSAGEDGREASDWLIPWVAHPSQVQVILSRTDPVILDGLRDLAPHGRPLLMDWRNQMWLCEPATVAATLAELTLGAFNTDSSDFNNPPE